jgi:hypothetical protein
MDLQTLWLGGPAYLIVLLLKLGYEFVVSHIQPIIGSISINHEVIIKA